MSWRLAKSLVRLREEIDARWPGRSKAHDGSIGDRRHAARRSDHNPDDEGVVRAIDVTNDGMGYELAEGLRLSKDSRIKYVIFNRQMFSSYPKGNHPAWSWRVYSGSNPHKTHVHVSVVPDSRADSTNPWGLADVSHPEEEMELVKSIQQSLAEAGFDPGPVDGIWGPRTQAAFVAALRRRDHTHEATVRLS